MPGEADDGGRQVAPAGPELATEIFDRLDALPDDRRREMMAVLYQHAGPLPDPATFAAYGTIYTDAPREILAMAVRQQEHDIDMASRMLTSEVSYRRETLAAALVAFLAVVAGATTAAVTGHEIAAGSIAAMGGVAFAVGAWLKGRDLFPRTDAAPATIETPAPPPIPSAPTPQPPRPRPARPQQRGRR